MPEHPDEFDPAPGHPVELSPGLRRILAPNPSPMTYKGTNTYLLGKTVLAVIDPGPLDLSHLEAILAALSPGQRISHIFVTHTHLDHSPLARPLSERTGAPIYAFGDALAGRSKVMQELAKSGFTGGGEGIDTTFRPDIELCDQQRIEGPDWALDVIHTPGHLGNHIALGWDDICFTADHVMGWASSLVSPPGGDLSDFMSSCRRLQNRNWRAFHPGHGAPVTDPADRLGWLIAHRMTREAEILATLADAPACARTLAEAIYVDTPAALLGAASRNVFAHLVDLYAKNRVSPVADLSFESIFHRV